MLGKTPKPTRSTGSVPNLKKTKSMLLRIVKEANTTYLTLLNAIKDAITKVLMDEWKDIPQFFEDIQEEGPEIQVVLGKHDGLL